MVAGLVITLIDSSMCGAWLWALVTGKKSTTHTLVEIQLVRPWESSCIFSFHRSDNVESAGVFVLAILGECVWRVRGLLCPIASLPLSCSDMHPMDPQTLVVSSISEDLTMPEL